MKDLISDEGYETRVAANYNQALTEIDKKLPDVAIIDVKLDKGDIGSCPTDKKPAGGFPYSGRQEITHKLPIGHSIFETDLLVEGAPSKRTTIFQIHDGRNSGAPPSWIGLDGGWKIIHKFPKRQCSQQNCRMHKFISLDTGKTYKFKQPLSWIIGERKIMAVILIKRPNKKNLLYFNWLSKYLDKYITFII